MDRNGKSECYKRVTSLALKMKQKSTVSSRFSRLHHENGSKNVRSKEARKTHDVQ